MNNSDNVATAVCNMEQIFNAYNKSVHMHGSGARGCAIFYDIM